MVIGMANWIQLPTRRSNSTYEAAVIVSRHTRHMVRWCARLAALPHITRRPQNYGSEFNPRCEKRSPNGPCKMLCEMFGRCSEETSQSCGPVFGGHHGVGQVSPASVSRPLSFSLRSSL